MSCDITGNGWDADPIRRRVHDRKRRCVGEIGCWPGGDYALDHKRSPWFPLWSLDTDRARAAVTEAVELANCETGAKPAT
jgi:trans-aconitate methyltransferase